jgi:hypothetical protein
MGQKAQYFHAAAAIANRAGIFHFTRTLDFAKIPELISELAKHWLEIGLMEKAA